MFNHIKGIVTNVSATNIVLETNNIGYLIKAANPFSYKKGEETKLYTYLHVREDILDLYGFRSTEERELFLSLISVKGIGPKTALAIIAKDDVKNLKEAIETQNAKYLQRFPGVGPKASNQIILDLKGKLGKPASSIGNQKLDDVKAALSSLGYSQKELRKIDNFIINNSDLSIEELVKESLKKLF